MLRTAGFIGAMAALLVLALTAGCSDQKPAKAPDVPQGPKAVRKKIIMAPFQGEGVPLLARTGPAAMAPAEPVADTKVALAAAPAALTPVTAAASAGGATPLVAGAEGLGVSPSSALAEAGALSPGMRLGGGAGLGGADMELAYSYNPAGKVDPFKPFVKETAEGVKTTGGPAAEEPPPLPPGTPPPILGDYDWRQLKLVAVITKSLGGAALAMVEDPSNKKGYPVTKGVRLGRTNALVTEITLDHVTVEEMVKDYVTGEWQSRPQTIPVKKTAGD